MTMKQTEETAMSPIMKQYNELKEKRPEAFLLFRVGDFYEAYDEVIAPLIDACKQKGFSNGK